MGQYHILVNLDKKEWVEDYNLGCGRKLWEKVGTPGLGDALLALLAVSNGKGGGDFDTDAEMYGYWGGDRIMVLGDYTEDGDVSEAIRAEFGPIESTETTESLYHRVQEEWRDISPMLVAWVEREFGVRFIGTGWKNVVDVSGQGYGCDPKNLPEYMKKDWESYLSKHPDILAGSNNNG